MGIRITYVNPDGKIKTISNNGIRRDYSEEKFNKFFECCRFVEGENAELIRHVCLKAWRNLLTYYYIDTKKHDYRFTTVDGIYCHLWMYGSEANKNKFCHAEMVMVKDGKPYKATQRWPRFLIKVIEYNIAHTPTYKDGDMRL